MSNGKEQTNSEGGRSNGPARTQTPLFIVSSGRAGSTFLARILREHPRLLCVSDIFEPIGPEPYFDRDRLVGGREFFEILKRPSLPQRIDYWRRQPTNELLFLPEEDRMVSLLLTYTLPFLTEGRPMELLGELEEEVSSWDVAPIPNHLIAFFDWLRDRFGRDLWVERTGGSLPHMRDIISTWPDARIVHSFRDCRETSVSMMTGSFFRLYLELSRNPDLEQWDSTYHPPIEEMGSMLNQWVMDAVSALDQHPREQQANFAYEWLLEDPENTLLELLRFLTQEETTEVDRAWAAEQARRVRRPPLRFDTLSEGDRHRLEKACGAGLAALGYSSVGSLPARDPDLVSR